MCVEHTIASLRRYYPNQVSRVERERSLSRLKHPWRYYSVVNNHEYTLNLQLPVKSRRALGGQTVPTFR